MSYCTIDGCGKALHCKGVCMMHYLRMRSHGSYDKIAKQKTYLYPYQSEKNSWRSMLRRCYHEKSWDYKYYGGRGIEVCGRWIYSFNYFLEDMGPKPTPKHTIERIDNNGNYEPSNCRWATMVEQRANKRVL